MYEVDELDRVVPLSDLPQASIGAPLPLVIADESRVVLAYYAENPSPGGDGTSVRVVDPVSSREPVVIVRFNRAAAHMFGPPSDEAFRGHPLAGRGLKPYSTFRVEHSSWIRRLERMNSVHPYHQPERFRKLQHLVFAFHDSTFECVCEGFDFVTRSGSIETSVPEMVKMLAWRRPVRDDAARFKSDHPAK